MERKIIEKESGSYFHKIPILENNGAEVIGPVKAGDYIEESKYHNGNYKEIALIGEFSIEYTEEDFLNEKTIADNIKHGKTVLNYKLEVYSGEGPIPHFHLVSKGENDRDKKIDTCICIFEARYFDHGTHVSTLSSKELKVLNEFLKEQKNPIGGTYWDIIATQWYELNPDNITRYQYINKKQPDYTHMLGYKSGR